jgi:hypothetical protein
MSNNSTKKQKQSFKQLQKQLKTTIAVWEKTADQIEMQADKDGTTPSLYEVLMMSAAIYRTCCVDLRGVYDGRVVLSEEDAAKLTGVVANN